MIVFPGFQLLDAAGPVAVLEMAERFRPDNYSISVLAPGGGIVCSSSGVSLAAAPLAASSFDAVIVSGGTLAQVKESQPDIVGWLCGDGWRRAAGVCSGAFFIAPTLADLGLVIEFHALSPGRAPCAGAMEHPDVKVRRAD